MDRRQQALRGMRSDCTRARGYYNYGPGKPKPLQPLTLLS